MKYVTQNGWTKKQMKAQIKANVPEHGAIKGGKLDTRCTYRAQNGTCAIGAFIDDETAAKYEYASVFGMRNDDAALKQLPLNFEGSIRLQEMHDRNSDDKDINVPDVLCKWIDENVVDAEPA